MMTWQVGLGFGVVTSILNIACAVVPLAVAAAFTGAGGRYIPGAVLIFVALGALGAAAGVYLNLYDLGHDSVLNRGQPAELEEAGSNNEVWVKFKIIYVLVYYFISKHIFEFA
jgi:hypothetical protein